MQAVAVDFCGVHFDKESPLNDPHRIYAWAAVVVLLTLLPAASGRGEVVEYSEPSADWWVYQNSNSSGTRTRGPTFNNLSIDPGTGQFAPRSVSAPARYGQALFAFETMNEVPALLDPSRYLVNSVSFSVRTEFGFFQYESEPITPAELLAEATGSGLTTKKPIELFGVGFRGGLEGFAFGANQSGQRLGEADEPNSSAEYFTYPIAGDGQGEYVDVSNSYTGGFSATAPANQTAPFTATPWAVGQADLISGQTVANNELFTFDLDLALPGVEEYVQQSLSEGVLGFIVSSMHESGFGSIPRPYPQLRLDNGADVPEDMPMLAIDVTILPLPGDYNGDESVDQVDYLAWKAAFGQPVASPFDGADGNGDGFVDAGDYTVWRDSYAASTTQSVSAIAVPEPSSGMYVIGGVLTTAFCFGVGLWPSSRGPRS